MRPGHAVPSAAVHVYMCSALRLLPSAPVVRAMASAGASDAGLDATVCRILRYRCAFCVSGPGPCGSSPTRARSCADGHVGPLARRAYSPRTPLTQGDSPAAGWPLAACRHAAVGRRHAPCAGLPRRRGMADHVAHGPRFAAALPLCRPSRWMPTAWPPATPGRVVRMALAGTGHRAARNGSMAGPRAGPRLGTPA